MFQVLSFSHSLFLDSSCYYRRKKKKEKNRTSRYHYSSTYMLLPSSTHIYIYALYYKNRTNLLYIPVKNKEMLDIMDTYNHDDMHHLYGKTENYKNLSMMMSAVPNKVKIKNVELITKFF